MHSVLKLCWMYTISKSTKDLSFEPPFSTLHASNAGQWNLGKSLSPKGRYGNIYMLPIEFGGKISTFKPSTGSEQAA